VRCFEDRHKAAQDAEEQKKAATKIQAIYRGIRERHYRVQGLVGRSLSLVEVDNDGLELTKHKLPTSKKFKLLEKRLAAWEERWPAEVEKATKGCLDEFAKQVPSKAEMQELVHTLLEHELDGWENRLAQFDAARIEVEALIQRVDKHQEHLEELSVDELKKLLEGFVEDMNGRLEGHNRDFEEAAHARQALLAKIGALEVKLQNNTAGASSDGEPDGQGKQLQKQSEAEAWQNAVRKDLALVQRRIFAELRAESQLWLTDQQWAIATLDERISLTDQRLSRRFDELVLALGRGLLHQQVQVAEASALDGDVSTLETTPSIIPPAAHSASMLTAPLPRRQVQFQELPGSEEAQARFSAILADDKSEASTAE